MKAFTSDPNLRDPDPFMMNYDQCIVLKPWGYEYLMYQNAEVAVWYLYIIPHAKTSLHCHPNKKTSIILLSGEATVSFLNDECHLKPLSKVMIRPGLFHSTQALSESGISVIETETPCNKADLIRLDDDYGRQGKPYEGLEATVPKTADCIHLAHPEDGSIYQYQLSDCRLTVEKYTDLSTINMRPPGEIIVVLNGGLVSGHAAQVLGPGDVVTSETIQGLAKSFPAPDGISFLGIRR